MRNKTCVNSEERGRDVCEKWREGGICVNSGERERCVLKVERGRDMCE